MSTENDQALQVRADTAVVFSPQQVSEQVQLIQHVMKDVMQEGEHWGVVPGCGKKPALLKPGAEKLSLTFRMAPKYDISIIELGNGHREVRVKCSLYHIETGKFLGEGVGSCSTMETKYRYRESKRTCPSCGSESIIKGKAEYGGGWLCFSKKGGCGAKFSDGEKAIEGQASGKAENADIADTYNTVLKMGKKRAQVDAVLSATAASDIFTQDIEEMGEMAVTSKTEPAAAQKPVVEEKAPPARESQNEVPNSTRTIPLIPSTVEKKLNSKNKPCWIITDIADEKYYTWEQAIGDRLSAAIASREKLTASVANTVQGVLIVSINPPSGSLLSQNEQRTLLTLAQERNVSWQDLRSFINNQFGAINLADVRTQDYSKVYEWLIKSERPAGAR